MSKMGFISESAATWLIVAYWHEMLRLHNALHWEPEPEQASGSLESVKGMLSSKSADTIGVG